MRILISILFVLWSLGSGWYYICHIKHACGGSDSTTATIIPNQKIIKPLQFKWSSFNIPLDSGFPDLKKAILEDKAASKVLELTGYYFPTEAEQNSEYDLGIARAMAVKKLLLADIPEDRIRLFSDTLASTTLAQDSLIEGIQYRWIEDTGTDIAAVSPSSETSSTEVPTEEVPTEETSNTTNSTSDIADTDNGIGNEDYFVKYFPYNQTKIPTDLVVFLDDLAAKLIAENKKVLIRGHTDSAGDKELNFKVGLRRAKKVRDQLIKRGVSKSRIETTSDGEESPIASNSTEEGRQQNRRIEIFIKD